VLVEVGREHWQSRAKRASAPFSASAERRYCPCVGGIKSKQVEPTPRQLNADHEADADEDFALRAAGLNLEPGDKKQKKRSTSLRFGCRCPDA
jgi:hypothetical protein